ncbi:hypothetical protein CDD81_2033 [Ophiocordyceps australis]|uniref:Transcription factor domain-containing protein n=1 Tax=Ophiocordyceps australis TaxID=1399860 RepID=A0A2C5XKB8_9HYPO|nr:hypothetical protein CDD81_2033 [Ophiocordyceps australis]
MHFYEPCPEELFQAGGLEQWMNLVSSGNPLNSTSIDFGSCSTKWSRNITCSTLGLASLLSAIRILVAEARGRLKSRADKHWTLIPGEAYLEDSSTSHIAPLLMEIYTSSRDGLLRANPHCKALWHNLCMNLTADLTAFELAAGRHGPQRGRAALADLTVWSQTSAARRCVVHAAQVYLAMSERKPMDATLFMSEIAVFNAGIVLGIYFLVLTPASETQGHCRVQALELLQHVDMSDIGTEGLAGHVSWQSEVLDCPVRRFIRQGGSLSFSGTVYHGGYYFARKILVEYMMLLEEFPGSSARQRCRLLQILSDTIAAN